MTKRPDDTRKAMTLTQKILAAHAIGSRPRAFDGAENCSLHTIVVLGNAWQLRRFNDTTHLDG